jgi:mono/diheme cytochrome c family protein
MTHEAHSTVLRHLGVAGLSAGLLLAMAVAGAGCRGQTSDKPPRQFLPDLDDQMRWNPQYETEFFADGRVMRPLVPGTVPYGRWDGTDRGQAWGERFRLERAAFLAEDDRLFRGKDESGEYVETIPMPVDRDMVTLGREKFDIYCSACHGYMGDGKGLVGERWAYPLPNFHDEKYKDRSQQTGKDGYMFETLRNGLVEPNTGARLMPAYDRAIDPYEAWAVVSYIRALQAAGPRVEPAANNEGQQ